MILVKCKYYRYIAYYIRGRNIYVYRPDRARYADTDISSYIFVPNSLFIHAQLDIFAYTHR